MRRHLPDWAFVLLCAVFISVGFYLVLVRPLADPRADPGAGDSLSVGLLTLDSAIVPSAISPLGGGWTQTYPVGIRPSSYDLGDAYRVWGTPGREWGDAYLDSRGFGTVNLIHLLTVRDDTVRFLPEALDSTVIVVGSRTFRLQELEVK